MTLHKNHDAHGKHHVHNSGVGQNHVESPDDEFTAAKYLTQPFSFSCKLRP